MDLKEDLDSGSWRVSRYMRAVQILLHNQMVERVDLQLAKLLRDNKQGDLTGRSRSKIQFQTHVLRERLLAECSEVPSEHLTVTDDLSSLQVTSGNAEGVLT